MWDAAAEADRWRRQADNDLAFARLALRERFYAQACFIAQQAAEKAVKSIAYGSGERAVLGHSLVMLVSRYAARAPGLADLTEAAGILDQCYVPTRYPNGLAGGVPFTPTSRRDGAGTTAARAGARRAAGRGLVSGRPGSVSLRRVRRKRPRPASTRRTGRAAADVEPT